MIWKVITVICWLLGLPTLGLTVVLWFIMWPFKILLCFVFDTLLQMPPGGK